jgi:hypothetical protein
MKPSPVLFLLVTWFCIGCGTSPPSAESNGGDMGEADAGVDAELPPDAADLGHPDDVADGDVELDGAEADMGPDVPDLTDTSDEVRDTAADVADTDDDLGDTADAADTDNDLGDTADADGDTDADANTDAEVGPDTPANAAPVADAGADQTALEGEVVTLDAEASVDPDGDALTYLWSQEEGVAVEFDVAAARPMFAAPDRAGALRFSLVVSDGSRDSEADTVSVEIENVPPVADAGEDQAVSALQRFELNGGATASTLTRWPIAGPRRAEPWPRLPRRTPRHLC